MEKLNSTDLSKAFSVSKTSIKNWIDRGCPHTKTDKGHEFVLSDVIKWHQERFVKNSHGDASKLAESRAMREHFKALLTELEFKERSGELVETKFVNEFCFNTARLLRDQLLNIPNRIAPILAAETDTAKVRAFIDKEIRDCLIDFVDTMSKGIGKTRNESEGSNESSQK